MKIGRVARVAMLALGILAVPLAAEAQQAAKISRIGFLSPSSPSDPRTQRFCEAFRQGLRELGWVEGQNIAIEYRWAEERTERLAALASELVSLKAARALGVRLQPLEARGPSEIDNVFAAMARERAGGVIVLADTAFIAHRTRIADLAAKSRLPAVYGLTDHAQAGGLMAYGPNIADLYRRAATYVDKILRGAKPADLPVEQPTTFELVVNMRTAKALGLTIPPSILIRADQVLE
jgi:ABC-type uncharacterized transport system substrate-binding protein